MVLVPIGLFIAVLRLADRRAKKLQAERRRTDANGVAAPASTTTSEGIIGASTSAETTGTVPESTD